MKLEDLTLREAWDIIDENRGGRWSFFQASATWRGGEGIELWFPQGCPEVGSEDDSEMDHVYRRLR